MIYTAHLYKILLRQLNTNGFCWFDCIQNVGTIDAIAVDNIFSKYSKASIKHAQKNQIIWWNNWQNNSDFEKASNLCHKFDAFSQSWAILPIISSNNLIFFGHVFIKILLYSDKTCSPIFFLTCHLLFWKHILHIIWQQIQGNLEQCVL